MANYVVSNSQVLREPNPFILIERSGRKCYKSESAYTEETAKKFYADTLVAKKHHAMLEHATFAFEVVCKHPQNTRYFIDSPDWDKRYLNITYHGVERRNMMDTNGVNDRVIVSGSLRALNECGSQTILSTLMEIDPYLVYSVDLNKLDSVAKIWEFNGIKLVPLDIRSIKDLTYDEFMLHHYTTFSLFCDIGVGREVTRHRNTGFAQESTRYCNYSKDKYGNQITIVEPSTYNTWSKMNKWVFRFLMWADDKGYMFMVKHGLQPQQARCVLPLCLKTEIVMTANAKEYKHFFDLRYRETTGKAHPDMLFLTDTHMYHQYQEDANLCPSFMPHWV